MKLCMNKLRPNELITQTLEEFVSEINLGKDRKLVASLEWKFTNDCYILIF